MAGPLDNGGDHTTAQNHAQKHPLCMVLPMEENLRFFHHPFCSIGAPPAAIKRFFHGPFSLPWQKNNFMIKYLFSSGLRVRALGPPGAPPPCVPGGLVGRSHPRIVPAPMESWLPAGSLLLRNVALAACVHRGFAPGPAVTGLGLVAWTRNLPGSGPVYRKRLIAYI